MGNQIVIKNSLISFDHSGTGESAVIFLHGWRSQKEVWKTIVDQVTKLTSCEVYAIDLPGFGGSPAPQGPWMVGDYVAIVKSFIEKLELKNVILIGHSFGGRVGIKFASKYPSHISRLVLVDSAGFANQTAKKSAIGIVAKIAKPFFKAKFMQGLRQRIYKTIGAEDYLATPNLQKTFVNVVTEDLSADMGKINCPTLIITGENDKDTPKEFGQRMQTLIPNSKFTILTNAGHFSFLDQTQEFVGVLVRFLQK